MSECLTPNGMSGHGPPDPLDVVTYAVRGCCRCGKETRAYTTIGDKDYCDTCAQHIHDLQTFQKLIGTGDP